MFAFVRDWLNPGRDQNNVGERLSTRGVFVFLTKERAAGLGYGFSEHPNVNIPDRRRVDFRRFYGEFERISSGLGLLYDSVHVRHAVVLHDRCRDIR